MTDLIDIPSLIESRDDALTALVERDAAIAAFTTRVANLEAANIALQYKIIERAETAGYVYEMIRSLLIGTMRVSTHRNAIKKAMAKLLD